MCLNSGGIRTLMLELDMLDEAPLLLEPLVALLAAEWSMVGVGQPVGSQLHLRARYPLICPNLWLADQANLKTGYPISAKAGLRYQIFGRPEKNPTSTRYPL
jgi:hypothetical protein